MYLREHKHSIYKHRFWYWEDRPDKLPARNSPFQSLCLENWSKGIVCCNFCKDQSEENNIVIVTQLDFVNNSLIYNLWFNWWLSSLYAKFLAFKYACNTGWYMFLFYVHLWWCCITWSLVFAYLKFFAVLYYDTYYWVLYMLYSHFIIIVKSTIFCFVHFPNCMLNYIGKIQKWTREKSFKISLWENINPLKMQRCRNLFFLFERLSLKKLAEQARCIQHQ